MEKVKAFIKSKTMLFYGTMGIAGALIVLFGIMTSGTGTMVAGLFVMVIAAIGIGLRYVTKESLSTKGIIKSKTIIFNTLLVAVGGIELYSQQLSGFFADEKFFGLFMVIVSVIGFILRSATVSPIGEES